MHETIFIIIYFYKYFYQHIFFIKIDRKLVKILNKIYLFIQ